MHHITWVETDKETKTKEMHTKDQRKEDDHAKA
jgi:hypothetical protein